MYIVSEDEVKGHYGDLTPPLRSWLLLVNYGMLALLIILTVLFIVFSTYAQSEPDNTRAVFNVQGQLFHHFLTTLLMLLLAVQVAKHGPLTIRSYVPRRIKLTYWASAILVVVMVLAWWHVLGIMVEAIFSNMTDCMCLMGV